MSGPGIKLDLGLGFTKLSGKGPPEPNKLRQTPCDSMNTPDRIHEVDPLYTYVFLQPQAISHPHTQAV